MFNFKKLLIVALFVLTIAGCGNSDIGNLTFSNDSITTKTQEIIKGGITTDLNQMIKGDWLMHTIDIVNNSYSFYSDRNILFDNEEFSVVGAPEYGDKFDPTIFKYDAEYFINYIYENFSINSYKKDCETTLKGKFFQTDVPNGTAVYTPDLFDVKITYEIVKEGSDTKLRLTTNAKRFAQCCDLNGGECNDRDFSGPLYKEIKDFLIVGVNKDGFVLQSYTSNLDGTKTLNTKSAFSFLKN